VEEISDWLGRQLDTPGALFALIQLVVILLLVLLPLRLWRLDRRRASAIRAAEARSLADIADYICDLTVAVNDALRDEVTAQEFVETFDRQELDEAALMLGAIAPQSLPSLLLLRPLFELRWGLEQTQAIALRIQEIMEDPARTSWQETRSEISDLAERQVAATEEFRRFADTARRGEA
jgi:hypothetical protein